MTGTTPRDRGAVTAFVTIFTTAVIFVVGLVFDGGRLLSAQRQADNEAASAARAAAQAIDIAALRAGTTTNVLNPAVAANNVCDYFAQIDKPCNSGDYTVVVDGNRVTVRVRITVDLRILPGANRTMEGEATACNELGLNQAIIICN
ncbi:MAG TPA: pilus assembly protein TadG-related protein [Acidimicrobiales bacterium]|jgi:hypothetical protein